MLPRKRCARSPGRHSAAWHGRYRTLVRRGKLKTVAITAVARELAGFIWAVSREITTARSAGQVREFPRGVDDTLENLSRGSLRRGMVR